MAADRSRWIPWLTGAVLFAAVLAGLALRLARMGETLNYLGVDPAVRAHLAGILREEGWGSLYSRTVWLPLHIWLLAWSQTIFEDPDRGARLPGVIAGAFCAVPAFLIASRALGLHRLRAGLPHRGPALVAGSFAALLITVEPLGVAFAAISYPEALSTLFILAGVAALQSPLKDLKEGEDPPPGSRHWWLAIPAFCAASLMRYEPWALTTLFLLPQPAPLRRRFAAGVAAVALPMAWVAFRPAYFVRNSLALNDPSEALPRLSPERIEAMLYYPELIGRLSSPWMIALLFGGLLWCVALRNGRPLAAAFAALSAFLYLSVLFGHVPSLERYFLTQYALFCVAGGVLLGWIGTAQQGGKKAAVCVAAALLSVGMAGRGAYESRHAEAEIGSWAPPGMDEIAQALGQAYARDPGREVYVDPHRWDSMYIYWRAGIRPGAVHSEYPSDHGSGELAAQMIELREGRYPAWLVAHDEGDVTRLLGLPPGGCEDQRVGAAQLSCLRRAGPYRLYDLRPISPPRARSRREP